VPRDIGAIRSHDPELAARWRVAVREALEPLLSNGGRIEGFDRSGWEAPAFVRAVAGAAAGAVS
jgi:predicted GNAT superfamily acetyltransferase